MSEIIVKTEAFAVELLSTELDPKYLYHNLKHTQRVVKSTKELIEANSLDIKEKEVRGRMFSFKRQRFVLSDGTEVIKSVGRPK